MTHPCSICESATTFFGEQTILGKYRGVYRRCTQCGYIHVVDPHWLDEAYGTAIAALDTGIVARNLWLADACCALLGTSLRQVRTTLDHGGGTGLLVRLMRDRGHDFRWRDGYSPNLLAIGFDAQEHETFDLVTAFELVEHLPDPMAGFATLHGFAPRMLISTELVPAQGNGLGQWWYYAPESGQHIGFFTRRSLQVVAERLQLRLSSNGRNLHVLADETVSEAWLQLLGKPKRARGCARLGWRRSLAHRDADLLQARLQSTTPRSDQ